MSEVYRVADFVADFIKNSGIGHVFMLPGGGCMYLVDAIGKCDSLEAIACLHEQAASISAEAYSRISNKPGVALVTSGPGATNAITGLVGAWIESVPLILISGQVKTSDMMEDAPIRQSGVQEVDIVKIVKNITKFAVTVRKPSEIRSILQKAFHIASSGRAGPVWIDIPLDIQGAPIKIKSLDKWAKKREESVYKLKKSFINKTVKLLNNSQRPLLLAGHGVRLSGAHEIFREVIEKYHIPTITTWNALDLIPYDHPLNIGRPGTVALRAPNFAVQNCDLLVSIGSRLDNIITAFNPERFAPHAKKVIVDIDKNEIDRHKMKIDLKINCDALVFLEELKKNKWNKKKFKSWEETCTNWKRKYSLTKENLFKITPKISHYQLINALSKILPENIVISTGSSGLGIEAFYTVFKNKIGQRVYLTSGLGAMGYGLPSAIGACLANNKRPMVLIEGDGSLQLNIQEMATISGNNLPICLIIINEFD